MTASPTSDLRIVSHVGRDILQSAQSFRTLEAAIWEYIVNSLQYLDPGVIANVQVVLDVKARVVRIIDNGSGMDLDGLQHFFTMHGENRERRRGVPGRGKFGTGKSAAFGIGRVLRVDTVRDQVRQRVYVDRQMIEEADGDAIPLRFEARDEPAPGVPNGTTITIEDVAVKLKREPVVSLIERHLTAFAGTAPVVTVNGRVCEITRPQFTISRAFTAGGAIAEKTGPVTLTVRAAVAPLEPEQRGVQVTVGAGNLVAIETAGVDTKEYGNRLFGEVDCPALDDPSYDPVSAYSPNRDLTLNKAHPVAMALTAFIGASLEQVRTELVEQGRQARADAEAKRLRATTSAIEEILNADLGAMRDRLEDPLGNIRRRTPLPAPAGGQEPDDTSFTPDPDGEHLGVTDGVLGTSEIICPPNPEPQPTPPGGEDHEDRGDLASPAGRPDPAGDEMITPAGGKGSNRPRGGLAVETGHLGADYDRYHWDKASRVITINLDHPVVTAARAVQDDETAFRRLCYEIAFTAYAIALTDLQLERDAAMDAQDAMYEVRQALGRVWRQAEALYAA